MDNGLAAFQYFVGQGLSPAQAAGIVGNLQGESGQGLNTGAINRGDGRDGSDSIGIGQWNGTRAQALKAYADSKGVPWTDLNTQLEFLHSELKGPEAGAYKNLLAAQTPEEAGRAFLAYERPKDWNVPGSHPERAKYAVTAFNAYGGGNLPVPSKSAPAVPQTAPAGFQPSLPAAPIFSAQAPQQAPESPSLMAQIPAETLAAPPIMFAPRRSPDLSKLRAAFGGFSFGKS